MNELVLEYDCPILNIGQQKGDWGYINFIEERALGATAVMKGLDCIGRPFLVCRAALVLENGEQQPTFSTFYQKYVNNKNIWQCFNSVGMELLRTTYNGDGYNIDKEQIALLKELLTYQTIDLCAPDTALLFNEPAAVQLYLRL